MNPTVSSRKNFLVIHNPKAGARRNLFHAVLNRLHDLGVEVEVQSTTGPGSARDLARSAAETGGHDAVIAAGGDGTINETVNGLSGHQIPLGIIPVGTANVLALEMGLSQDPENIARALVAGPVRSIVPGAINGRLFLLMVGAGWDGRLVAHTTTRLKRFFGKFAFLWHGLELLAQNRVPRLSVVADFSDAANISAVCAARALPLCQMTSTASPASDSILATRVTSAAPSGVNPRCGSTSFEALLPCCEM